MVKQDVMIKDPEAIIQEAKKRLVKAYDPVEIYLFGEYVYREPDKYSELGFVIVVPETDVFFYERPQKAYRALMDLNISNDVIVWSKQEFDERKTNKSSWSHHVAHEGRKIYDKTAQNTN